MDKLHLTVLTSTETVLDRRADYVNLPLPYGSLGILGGHAPLLCALGKGVLRCTGEEGAARVLVNGGVADVQQNEVTILASSAQLLPDDAER